MKRLSAFLLSFALMLVMVPVVSAEPATVSTVTPPAIPTTGDVWDGSIEQPTTLVQKDGVYYYEITKCSQLAYVAQTGGEWISYNYALGDNLILNDTIITSDENGNCANSARLLSWTPINGFTGNFMGNNYCISGLYINSPSNSSVGLFSNLVGNVNGLIIVNAYLCGNNNVGGIAGHFSGNSWSYIKNCSFSGTIKGNSYVGGISGNNGLVVMSNLRNYGSIIGNGNYVAGIAGNGLLNDITYCANYGSVINTGNHTAGIAGYSHFYSVSHCVNYGSVTGADNVGGILAEARGTSLNLCNNCGTITGNSCVGGVVGISSVFGSNPSISNSYNAGSVKGDTIYGGIIGKSVYCTVTNCYSVINIQDANLSGIVGDSDHIWGRSQFSHNYYLNTATVKGCGNSDDEENSIQGKNTHEMKMRETYVDWRFEPSAIWAISPDRNGGYPYLAWQDALEIPLTGLALSHATLSLGVGDAVYLSVSQQPATAALPVLTWTSSDESVATVNQSGRVSAIEAGTATITVSDGEFSATCTVTVSARATEEYRLGELTVRDANGAALMSIPRSSFLVTIPVTKLTAGGNTMVMFASYTASGQFKGLLYASVEDVPVGATVKITLPVDNSKGDIALLKAFTIASFSNPVPIGAAVSFPVQ